MLGIERTDNVGALDSVNPFFDGEHKNFLWTCPFKGWFCGLVHLEVQIKYLIILWVLSATPKIGGLNSRLAVLRICKRLLAFSFFPSFF